MHIWVSQNNKAFNTRHTVLTAHVTTDSGSKFDLSLAIVSYDCAFNMVLDFSDWSKDYLQKEEVMRFESMLLSRLKKYFTR